GRWTGIAARSLQTRGGAASKAPPAVAAAARIAAESQAGRPGLHQVGYFARFATTGVSIGPWPMSITLVRLSSSPFTLPEYLITIGGMPSIMLKARVKLTSSPLTTPSEMATGSGII